VADGREVGHLGFLLTEVEACGDAELVALTIYEVRTCSGPNA